jgi:hypothetical protein
MDQHNMYIRCRREWMAITAAASSKGPRIPPWAWQYLSLAALIALIITLRDITAFAYPQLSWEDGKDIFAYFYSRNSLSEIFRFKSGYIPLAPNIAGLAITSLPTELIPYAFVVAPLILSTFTYSLFFSPQYRSFVASDWMRAVACILFALSPVFHHDIQLGIDYAIWNCLFALCLLSIINPPKSRYAYGIWILLIIIFIGSNPLSVVVLPIYLYRACTTKDLRARATFLFFCACIALYQLTGVESSGIFEGLSITQSLAKAGESLGWTLYLLFKQAYKAIFGIDQYMKSSKPGLAAFALISTYLLAKYAQTGIKSRIRLLLIVLYFSFSIIFLSVLSRGFGYVGLIHINMRYMFVPSMFTYILFISVIEQFLTSTAWPSNAIRNSSGNIQSHRLASIAIANQDTNRLKTASLLILLFYYLHNLQMGYFDKNLLRLGKSGPYSPSLDNGLIIRTFFRELAEAEVKLCKNPEAVANQKPVFASKKHGDWSFSVQPICR